MSRAALAQRNELRKLSTGGRGSAPAVQPRKCFGAAVQPLAQPLKQAPLRKRHGIRAGDHDVVQQLNFQEGERRLKYLGQVLIGL